MNALAFQKTTTDLTNKEGVPYEREYLMDILTLAPKQLKIELTGDFLTDLFTNFHTDGRIIGFAFDRELTEQGPYRFFASIDIDKIGEDTESGEIVLYDSFDNKVIHRLAKDIKQFIQVALVIFEYELPGWCKDKQYNFADRSNLYLDLKALLEADYLSYYEETYSS